MSHLGDAAVLSPSADQLLAFSREKRFKLRAAELWVSTQLASVC